MDLNVLEAILHSVLVWEILRRWNLVEQSSFHHTAPLGGPDLILSKLDSHALIIALWSDRAASVGSEDVRIEKSETYDLNEFVHSSFFPESM